MQTDMLSCGPCVALAPSALHLTCVTASMHQGALLGKRFIRTRRICNRTPVHFQGAQNVLDLRLDFVLAK